MQLQSFPLDALRSFPENYNAHPPEQIAELMKSLDQFGQFKNIVVCQGRILAGHGLVEAARRRGDSHIAALVRDDLTETQQRALLLADNATPAGALPDISALQALIDSMGDVEVPGVTDDWLREMCGEPDSRPMINFAADDDDGGSGHDEAGADRASGAGADANTVLITAVVSLSVFQQWSAYKSHIGVASDGKALQRLLEERS